MIADSPASGKPREPFHARSLSCSLTVKDVNRSLAWYCDVLGFAIDRKMEREGRLVGVALQAGDVRLLLNQDNGAKGADRSLGQGFSMMLTTTQNIDAVASQVRAAGGTLDSEPADMPWGARVFRVRDPDGYGYAISSERAPT